MLINLYAGCPVNFTYVASVNGCYKLVTQNAPGSLINWYDAVRECQSLHSRAHLLVINDAQEQLAVATSQFSFLVLFIVSLTPDRPELGKPKIF